MTYPIVSLRAFVLLGRVVGARGAAGAPLDRNLEVVVAAEQEHAALLLLARGSSSKSPCVDIRLASYGEPGLNGLRDISRSTPQASVSCDIRGTRRACFTALSLDCPIVLICIVAAAEADETRQKAQAVLSAVMTANQQVMQETHASDDIHTNKKGA